MPVGVAVALTIVLILQALLLFCLGLDYLADRMMLGPGVWTWREDGWRVTKVFLTVVGIVGTAALVLFLLVVVLSAIWTAVG